MGYAVRDAPQRSGLHPAPVAGIEVHGKGLVDFGVKVYAFDSAIDAEAGIPGERVPSQVLGNVLIFSTEQSSLDDVVAVVDQG